MMSANLRLHELNTGVKCRVAMAVRRTANYLFKYQGQVGTYYLIGGVDPDGPHLFNCSANGHTQRYQYHSDGQHFSNIK
jgi:20S proteasome alpha/beta subunit